MYLTQKNNLLNLILPELKQIVNNEDLTALDKHAFFQYFDKLNDGI
jgi:hypothetical protein